MAKIDDLGYLQTGYSVRLPDGLSSSIETQLCRIKKMKLYENLDLSSVNVQWLLK